jgi:hypothetical protein
MHAGDFGGSYGMYCGFRGADNISGHVMLVLQSGKNWHNFH